MSGAVSLSTVAWAAAAAAGVSILTAPKQSTPKVQAPEAPPQVAQAPDQTAQRTSTGAAGPLGAGTQTAGTMLTGAAGVPTSSLNLGKNTLLGS